MPIPFRSAEWLSNGSALNAHAMIGNHHDCTGCNVELDPIERDCGEFQMSAND
jgi:hypothetical protein